MGSPVRPKRPRIVEFVGLPGAGKTTIVNLLCAGGAEWDKMEAHGRSIRFTCSPNGWGSGEQWLKSRLLTAMKIMLASLWVLTHPRLCRTVTAYAVCSSRQPLRLAFTRLKQFFWYLAFLTWIKIYTRFIPVSADYILLDQGVLQAMLGLDLGNVSPPVEIFDDILWPDIVVYLDVDSALASRRVFERPSAASRLDRMDIGSAQTLMHELKSVFDTFMRALQSRRTVTVITVPSREHEMPGTIAAGIVERLRGA